MEQHFRIDDLRKYSHAYMIGIGGISMSSLALILLEKGLQVSGYDRSPSALTQKLEAAGIKICYEDDPSMLEGVDLICYTAAVGAEHPQMRMAAHSGAKIIPRAELLGAIADSYGNAIAVAGTHGKSTTSGMLSHLFLHSPGKDPTVVVGAKITELDSAYKVGGDENFIFEACEYKDSFLSFFPNISVVLNIQLDHTDYFPTLDHIRLSFERFMSNTKPGGVCIMNRDCENCKRAMETHSGRVITYSTENDPKADYRAANIDLSDGFGEFDVYKNGSFLLRAKLGVPGMHNVSNALAAVAAAIESGLSSEEIVTGLASYRGVNRRFEFLGEIGGARFFDDYAHHPDEIRVTLSAAKAITKGRVICAFQPHNYSRLRDLFDQFLTCFGDADRVVLTKLYAARESAGEEVSSALLADRLGADYVDDAQTLPAYLAELCKPGDTVLIMGAGDIGKVAEKIKKSKKIS